MLGNTTGDPPRSLADLQAGESVFFEVAPRIRFEGTRMRHAQVPEIEQRLHFIVAEVGSHVNTASGVVRPGVTAGRRRRGSH